MQPTIDRDPRVRFKHPVRVVPIGGPPRAYRVLASNISKDGMFLRMPTPFEQGTKVALSLEAGGRVLPFAQAEVVWRDLEETKAPGRGAGFGVRFTGFLHPRAHELVDYLVANLETGKPLSAPEAPSPWRKRMVWMAAGLAAVILGAGITTGMLTMYRAEPVAAPVEAAKVEAATVEAATVEAATVEAATVEAAKVEAAKVEAAKVEAAKVEAAKVEAAKVEAAAVEAPNVDVVTGAAKPEPTKTDAAKTEVAKTEAAKTETSKTEAAKTTKAETQTVAVPSGAVRSVNASVEGDQLALTLTLGTGAAITKAFTLRNPDRLAIDVRGAAPRKSHTVSGSGVIQKVRAGKLPRGTRIVLDLVRAPGKPVVVSGNSVSVPLR